MALLSGFMKFCFRLVSSVEAFCFVPFFLSRRWSGGFCAELDRYLLLLYYYYPYPLSLSLLVKLPSLPNIYFSPIYPLSELVFFIGLANYYSTSPSLLSVITAPPTSGWKRRSSSGVVVFWARIWDEVRMEGGRQWSWVVLSDLERCWVLLVKVVPRRAASNLALLGDILFSAAAAYSIAFWERLAARGRYSRLG